MQEGSRQQIFSSVLEKLSTEILGAHRDDFGARDVFAKIGNAQASLGAALAAFFADDDRIDQNQLRVRIFFKGDIDDSQTFRNADLWSGQSNATSGVHRLE